MMSGALLPELEADLLARRLRLDAPPDLGRSGEGDHRDVVVVDDRVADRSAASGDDVQHVGREAGLVEQHAASAIAEVGV